MRQARKAKTKTAHHLLIELAIAPLDARLYRILYWPGTDDIFECAGRPLAARRVCERELAKLNKVLADATQSLLVR